MNNIDNKNNVDNLPLGSLVALPLGSLVAYRERNSTYPMSCEEGVLRDEWRIRLVSDFDPSDLKEAWGTDWKRYKPSATHVLEHRYIRRGTEEPWMPFQSANSYSQVMDYVYDSSVALCPVLQKIKYAREAYAQLQKQKQEELEEASRAEKECVEHKEKSERTFERMARSEKNGHYAEKWCSFCLANDNDEARDTLLNDSKAMDAYDAVLDAITVPKKASAIKAFLPHIGRLGLRYQQDNDNNDNNDNNGNNRGIIKMKAQTLSYITVVLETKRGLVYVEFNNFTGELEDIRAAELDLWGERLWNKNKSNLVKRARRICSKVGSI